MATPYEVGYSGEMVEQAASQAYDTGRTKGFKAGVRRGYRNAAILWLGTWVFGVALAWVF